jgi:O-antigen/teichoic acid export membrane protein
MPPPSGLGRSPDHSPGALTRPTWAIPQEGAVYNLAGAALRVVSVGGKLLLILYLARFLRLEDLGVYGLTTTTVLLAVYVIGFDFYTFCARELLAVAPSARGRLLRDQLVCHGLGYVILAPALLVFFATGFLPWSVLGYFYWILVGTHLCQEIHRVLITLARPIAAYAISAVAHGIWPFPVVVLGTVYPELRTLDLVFLAWALSASGGVALGAFWLAQIEAIPRSPERIDWTWIRRGMTVSYKFFISSLLFRSIEFSNRYFLHYFWGDARVGVYTLYASVANTLHDLTATTVAAPAFAPLVASYQSGDRVVFSRQLHRLRQGLVRTSFILLPVFIAGLPILFAVIEKPLLYEQRTAYFVLLSGALLLNLSLHPHYRLYAGRMDNQIFVASAFAAAVNVAANVLLVPMFEVNGAAVAAASAMLALLVAKSVSVGEVGLSRRRSPSHGKQHGDG